MYLSLSLICLVEAFLLFVQVHTSCVSRPAYQKTGGTKLSLVQPGNYSVRVRATSLAGNGSFTKTTHFFMPNRKAGVLACLSISCISGVCLHLHSCWCKLMVDLCVCSSRSWPNLDRDGSSHLLHPAAVCGSRRLCYFQEKVRSLADGPPNLKNF